MFTNPNVIIALNYFVLFAAVAMSHHDSLQFASLMLLVDSPCYLIFEMSARTLLRFLLFFIPERDCNKFNVAPQDHDICH